jgi:hypothetical protein
MEGTGTTVSVLALVVSCLALGLSTLTAWLSLLRKGELRMTQPTQIYFGPDGGFEPGKAPSKVYLRSMLYATGKRGWVVENMFARVRRGETQQNFNIWVYGDQNSSLQRGARLFISETGIITNHHFVVPPDAKFDSLSVNTPWKSTQQHWVLRLDCFFRLFLRFRLSFTISYVSQTMGYILIGGLTLADICLT